jgi:hypothetical protein
MEAVLSSIMFRGINTNKLIELYNKYNNSIITRHTIESLNDKDELIFCYYWMKYQQKIEVSKLNDIFSSLSIN